MSDPKEIIEVIAKAIDPALFEYSDTPAWEDQSHWYARRQWANALATRILDALSEADFTILDWSDGIDAMGEDA